MLRFSSPQVVFQEVPGEISLALSISGCPLRCKGCHSAHTWHPSYGSVLDAKTIKKFLDKYDGMISCVLFYGGEWLEDQFVNILDVIKESGLKTCLYTGMDDVSEKIKSSLDYLKVGSWNPKLGGLDNPMTNQKFIDLRHGMVKNTYFQRI